MTMISPNALYKITPKLQDETQGQVECGIILKLDLCFHPSVFLWNKNGRVETQMDGILVFRIYNSFVFSLLKSTQKYF